MTEWKVLATCVMVFLLSFVALGIFGDRKRHYTWELVLCLFGIIVPVIIAVGDIFYLIWR